MKSIKKLSSYELIDYYSDAVKYWHYDPHGGNKPKYDMYDLERELRARLDRNDVDENDADSGDE
jgi:hypothetical protein